MTEEAVAFPWQRGDGSTTVWSCWSSALHRGAANPRFNRRQLKPIEILRSESVTATGGFRDDTPITYDSEVGAGLSQGLNVSETALFSRHLVIRLLVGCGAIRFGNTLHLSDGADRASRDCGGPQFGLLGLFIAILLIDTFPTPMSYAPLMLLAIQGGMPIWVVFIHRRSRVCRAGCSDTVWVASSVCPND